MTASAANAAHGDDDESVDPVCGEMFPARLAVFHSDHDGTRYHFCSKTCKQTFDAAPQEHTDLETKK